MHDEFIFHLVGRGIKSKHSLRDHGNRLTNLLNECKSFSEIELKQYLTRLLLDRGFSRALHNKYVQTIHHYCDFKEIPRFKIKRLKEEPNEYSVLNTEEIERFLSLPCPKYKAEYIRFGKKTRQRYDKRHWEMMTMFWQCLAFSGARPGEILKLSKDSISLGKNPAFLFSRSKTGTGREAAISPRLQKALKPYLEKLSTHLLFPAKLDSTRPISYTTYGNDFHQRLKLLGITRPIRTYDFRGAYITRTLDEGAVLFPIQYQVGHKNANTTQKYYRNSLKSMHREIKKDPMEREFLSDKELIIQVEKVIDGFSLEGRKGINLAYVKQAIGLLHQSVEYPKD